MAKYVYAITPDVISLSRLMVNKGLKPRTPDSARVALYDAYLELKENILEDIRSRGKGRFPHGVPVNMWITTRPPPGGDPDGYEKYVIDAICNGLGIDDGMIKIRHVERDFSSGEEYSLITMVTDDASLEWPDDPLGDDEWEAPVGATAANVNVRDPVSPNHTKVVSF